VRGGNATRSTQASRAGRPGARQQGRAARRAGQRAAVEVRDDADQAVFQLQSGLVEAEAQAQLAVAVGLAQ
jgi:hypothetical protein